MSENIKKSMREILDGARRDVEKIFEEAELKINAINNPFNLSLGAKVSVTEGSYKGRVCTISEISSCGEMVNVRELPTSFMWHFNVGQLKKSANESEIAPSKKKTANQQRAELVERAKRFVEENTKYDSQAIMGDLGIRFGIFSVHHRFTVDEEKRTVACLLTGIDNKGIVFGRGITKCMSDEVFNEHIGKAIALARALEIDVPEELLDAVQPDKAEVGMLIHPLCLYNDVRLYDTPREVFRLNARSKKKYPSYVDDSGFTRWSSKFDITDDTNAEYE